MSTGPSSFFHQKESVSSSLDIKIVRWILEFLVRRVMDDASMSVIFSMIPVSDDDYRLKKTILLKTTEFETSNGSVSEKMLDSFECIVELDKREGLAVLECMKEAYCAVAVDCTVRFMEEKSNEKGKYFEAVKRIWRQRICDMEKSEKAELVSNQLRNWRDELEAGVWNPFVRENVSMRNTRNEALKAVKIYVDEAWKVMGPTILEVIAQKTENSVESSPNAGQDLGGREKDQSEEQATTSHQDSDAAMRERNQVGEQATTSHQDLDVGVKPAMRDEDGVEEGSAALSNVGQDFGVSNEPTVRDRNQVGETASTLPSAGWDQGVTDEPATRNKDQAGERAATSHNAPAARDKETQKGNVRLKRKHAATRPGRSFRGRVKITDTEELTIKTSRNEYDCLLTPEVNKVQEALRSSSLELQAVVNDPLPEALRLAETVISELAQKEVNQEASVENQNRMDVDAPNPSVDESVDTVQDNEVNTGNQHSVNKGVEYAQANEGDLGNQRSVDESVEHVEANKGILGNQCSVDESVENIQANEGILGNQRSVDESVEHVQANEGNLGNQCSMRENNVSRHCLMERNSTAHTFEWDDSIDRSSEGSPSRANIHLPTPKRVAISPLKKYETTKFARRRKIKRWSLEEEDTLRTGVDKFGKGNWKLILNSYRDVFEERTEVDLKDKWRNMTR